MQKLPWKNIYFRVFLSLIATISLVYCINNAENSYAYTNSIGAFLLWAGWMYVLTIICEGEKWEEIINYLRPGAFFSFCFFGSLIAGKQLDRTGAVNFSLHFFAATVFISAAALPILGWFLWKLKEYNHKEPSANRDLERKSNFLKIWVFLFLAYIPTLVASYPGFFTYDAETEAYMVFTGKYSAHHPMLHVLLLGWTIRIMYSLFHSYNIGIVSYLILQMLILSACFAYMMNSLYRIGVKRWICNIGILFLAFFPTISMFVCCSTKDVLFSGGVVC